VRNVIVLFGGEGALNGIAQGDTWQFNGSTWASRSSPPSKRVSSAAAYDIVKQCVVMFGGGDGNSHVKRDTW
jgi:hypothetical protein